MRFASFRISNLLLLSASLVFYFWGEQWYLLVMLASTMIDYCCGLYIGSTDDRRTRKIAVGVSVTSNIALLAFFKYMGFGMDVVNQLLAVLHISSSGLHRSFHIALPLGISFYTFQSMSYTIDVYRGVVKPTRNLIDFASYVTMFPQLVAGPIVRYRDVARELSSRVVTLSDFSEGCRRFIIGLGKKVLIANTIASAVDGIFSVPGGDLTAAMAWLATAGFILQLYYDFSGYSDMAIGLGRMIGFRFRENFNYPFISMSLTEFWRRWHISLSTWFRDYLYKSIRGKKGEKGKRYIGLFIVFLLVGIWHGADWTFVLFGLYHAIFIVIERMGLGKALVDRNRVLRYAYAVPIIYFSFLIFRSESVTQLISFVKAMSGMATGDGIRYNLAMFAQGDVITAMIAGLIGSFPVVPWLSARMKHIELKCESQFAVLPFMTGRLLVLSAILLLSMISVSSETYNPFIYFRF